MSDGVLITSLSVIAFAELDQTVIWCADGSIGGDEIQNTTTRVAGELWKINVTSLPSHAVSMYVLHCHQYYGEY